MDGAITRDLREPLLKFRWLSHIFRGFFRLETLVLDRQMTRMRGEERMIVTSSKRDDHRSHEERI